MGINTISEQCIDGPIAKLAELPDGYVINGSVYDKVNTAPIPKSFLKLNTSAVCESVLKEMSTVGSGYAGLKTKKSYIIDKDDSNIVYLLMPLELTGNSTYGYFYKLRRNNGRYTVLGYVPMAAFTANYYYDCDLIDDDSMYVYFRARGTSDYGNTYLIRVNKATMATTNIDICTGSTWSNCVTFHPNIINGKLYCSIGTAAATISIGIIDLATYTMSTAVATDVTPVYGQFQYFKPVYENNCIIFFGVPIANKLYKFTYDISLGTLVATEAAAIPADITLTMNTTYTYNCVIPNKDYIIMVSRNECQTPTGVAEHRVLIFKRNSDNTVTYKGILDPGFKFNTFILAEADDLLYVCSKFRVGVISITEARELLKVQSIAPNYLHTIGRDNLGNMVLISDDTTVAVFNREIPIAISAAFEKEYKYIDTPIPSYMTISMKSHLGLNVTGNVKVELMGPFIFADGTQSKVVTVSGTVQVPIVIVGYGDLRYNITNE